MPHALSHKNGQCDLDRHGLSHENVHSDLDPPLCIEYLFQCDSQRHERSAIWKNDPDDPQNKWEYIHVTCHLVGVVNRGVWNNYLTKYIPENITRGDGI